MSWLLKIIEGPAKGAEIALVDGMRVRVGSSDTCDIVIADSTLDAEAFDLDVAPAAVTLIEPDGKAAELLPFEARTFGTTTFAVGPENGDWTKVAKRPQPSAPAADSPKESEPAVDEPETPEEPEKPKRRGCGCFLVLLALFLLLVVLFLCARFLPEGKNTYVDALRGYSEKTAAWFTDSWHDVRRANEGGTTGAPAANKQKLTLADIAAEHNLELSLEGKTSVLSGNVKRRTERLAIRALALAAEPSARLDLTDDESMRDAADELLFACTEGKIKAVAASNRVVTIRGYSPDSATLEKTIRALDADVPGIVRLDTSRVMVGGPTPEAEEVEVEEEEPDAPTPVLKRKRVSKKKLVASKNDYPVAGVLTVPYPCVVMRNGMRLCEGAMIGTAEIVKIEADKLTLREGDRTFEWEP